MTINYNNVTIVNFLNTFEIAREILLPKHLNHGQK